MKLKFAIVIAGLAVAWIGSAQQRRQVDDALLKAGSKTGDEWISYGGNWVLFVLGLDGK